MDDSQDAVAAAPAAQPHPEDDAFYRPRPGEWPLEVLGAISNISDDIARVREAVIGCGVVERVHAVADSLENGIAPLKRLVETTRFPAAQLPSIKAHPDDGYFRRAYLDGWNDQPSGVYAPRDNSTKYLQHYGDGWERRHLGQLPKWLVDDGADKNVVNAEIEPGRVKWISQSPPCQAVAFSDSAVTLIKDLPLPEELRTLLRASAAERSTVRNEPPGPWNAHDGRVWVLPGGKKGHKPCPVAPGTRIRVQHRDGDETLTDEPHLMRWGWTRPYCAGADILAWRMEP